MVYDYQPSAPTLLEKHFPPEQPHTAPLTDEPAYEHWELGTKYKDMLLKEGSNDEGVLEDVLWTYIAQLLSAMKAVHAAGLAMRVYDASNILITGRTRCVCFNFFCLHMKVSVLLDVEYWMFSVSNLQKPCSNLK